MENEKNPVIWPRLSTNRQDDKHRWEWCLHYNECLVEAAQKFWPSFTCYYCKRNPLSKEKEKEKGGENAQSN